MSLSAPVRDEMEQTALRFLERGFRNIELPPLSKDDLRDIAEALTASQVEAGEVGPSIFDLLEPLSLHFPDIRGGFARATGGVDIPYIIKALARKEQP